MGIKIECFLGAFFCLGMGAHLFFETLPLIKKRKDCDERSKRKQLLFCKFWIGFCCIVTLYMIFLGVFVIQ